MRIALTIEYDGTDYCGWQVQPNGDTVQQQLEVALFSLLGRRVRVHGAGRTDAGVHALGQVAHFDTECGIPPHKFCYALNQHLPPNICVLSSWQAEDTFHARFSAKGKHYRYLVQNRPHRPALWRNRAMHVPQALNVHAMHSAAQGFVGEHDFAALCAVHSDVVDTVRTIHTCGVSMYDGLVMLDVVGNGFLYNMVRIMMGTLLEVGLRKRPPDDIPRILRQQSRDMAGPTAAACGLYLAEVLYHTEHG